MDSANRYLKLGLIYQPKSRSLISIFILVILYFTINSIGYSNSYLKLSSGNEEVIVRFYNSKKSKCAAFLKKILKPNLSYTIDFTFNPNYIEGQIYKNISKDFINSHFLSTDKNQIPETSKTQLFYLSNLGNQIFSTGFILSKKRIRYFDDQHLFCGFITKNTLQPGEQRNSITSNWTINLENSKEFPKTYQKYPRVDRNLAYKITSIKAKQLLADFGKTLDLGSLIQWNLQKVNHKAGLLQVHYEGTYSNKKKGEIFLIGNYKNNKFESRHIHFSEKNN